MLKRGGGDFLDRNKKETFITDMNVRLKKAKATFLVDYQGLNMESMDKIRGELRKVDVEFQVVKNRLLKLACKDTDSKAIDGQFVGTCAIAITYNDVVAPAKVLVDLTKDIKTLGIKAGQISGRPMDIDGIKRLASLPSREQLLSQTLSVMQAVPTSMVRVLNGIILKLLFALKAVEDQKKAAA
jgi:large subunit ribosomal protein L10